MFVIILLLALTGFVNASCEGNKCSDPNASPQECPRSCQPTCARPNTTGIICTDECLPSGCVCNPGYILNETGGKCIKEEDCPSNCVIGCNGDPNAIAVNLPTYCQPTCNKPYKNGEVCNVTLNTQGCACKAGYVLEESIGLCRKPHECSDYPHQCPNDHNGLLKQCPNPCPATCANPNTRAEFCPRVCLRRGCECSSGYILSEKDGKCITPDMCPGGAPNCGANKKYVDCFADCPSRYCPVNDSCSEVCEITYPCLPGCECDDGYLMLSRDDPRCVPSSDCPLIHCTRPNEVWEPISVCIEKCAGWDFDCTDHCRRERRCVCRTGFYRNEDDICVDFFNIFF